MADLVRVQCRGLTARFVDHDAAAGLVERAAAVTTTRASHVEYDDARRGWFADMRPSGGDVLGPFRSRGEALAAERVDLRERFGL